ncbi:MAG: hypothetical protein ACRC1H_07880 [Caldilineaceae bacterium]
MQHTDDIIELAAPELNLAEAESAPPAPASADVSSGPESPKEPAAEVTVPAAPAADEMPPLDDTPAAEVVAEVDVAPEAVPAAEPAPEPAAESQAVPPVAAEAAAVPLSPAAQVETAPSEEPAAPEILTADLTAASAQAAAELAAAAHAEPTPRLLDEGAPRPAEPAVPPRIARFNGPLETPGSQAAGGQAAGAVVTVLQPLTPLKDVELLKRPVMPEDERRLLHTWNLAIERALREERPADAVRLAHPVLRQLPRHLATYYRLIRAAWMLRRWDEGDAWGRRLLRADPGNALAWRAVAMAVEQRGERGRAAARWQRAFECDPYEPEVRAGLVRTSLDLARLPQLNEACLGSLLLRGYRWEQAVTHFRVLTEFDGRRLDFQSNLLLALWQHERQQEAYDLARRLSQTQPYLLIAWVVIDEAGDENDKALARHPLSTMDPDGDYVRTAWGLSYPSRSIRLTLSESEKALIEGLMEPAQSG